MKNAFGKFTGLYPLSKTLRFELKPIGRTLEYIQKNGLLEQDLKRAESYVKVKKIIDDYHKKVIEETLSCFKLKYENGDEKDSLEEYFHIYMIKERDENQKKTFEEIQNKLRRQIAGCLTKTDAYKRIDKKELIKEDLIKFIRSEDYIKNLQTKQEFQTYSDADLHKQCDLDEKLVEEFKNFTTYFTGFHENRKNMYSAEAKSTAISYRLIHENLPKFIDNISVFAKAKATVVSEHFPQLYSAFESYLNVLDVSEIFTLNYFNVVLTQTQIDVYNTIIGGKTLEDGMKVQGLNEYINLYNQQQKDKKLRLPKLKPLFKQILSDRNAISWLPEEFNSDNELLEAIEQCYQVLDEQVLNKMVDGEYSLKQILQNLAEYDLSGIYIRNDSQLTDLSQKIFGDWGIISKGLGSVFELVYPQRKTEKVEGYEERKRKYIKGLESLSIKDINHSLTTLGSPNNKNIEEYFAKLGAEDKEAEIKEDLFVRISKAYKGVKDLLNTPYAVDKNLLQDKKNVAAIKCLLDCIKELQYFVKPLLGKGDEADKDEKFYGEFTLLWEELDKITPLYNKVRNYLTRKPYSTEKIKLNFENSTLMDGWDLNKERDNTTVILRRNNLYYLAIMNKNFNKVFDPSNIIEEGACYEKMEYKLLPGANKMLPKVFFSKSRIDEFKPSQQIQDNYMRETHKKGKNFNLADCHGLINFFKESINKHEDWANFNFNFSETNTYNDLSGFYREVEQQGYKITFRNISESYIDSLVEEGKLYLFQIYNKDFSSFSKGTPNMHTLYWRMLFDKENLNNVIYKLNGQAEVFFRKASIRYDKPTHPAYQVIKNKNSVNKKHHSTFDYDLVKDRRYTMDKFQFHVPITMNFKSIGTDNINQLVKEYIQMAGDMHVIGIDRGERHLLYLTVIDMHGNIKEQYSLNEIVNEYNGNIYHTNYHSLLDKREKEQQEARQSWQIIENIKELKEGYLSQVVHKVANLIVKYNAIVALEDLNTGFMRGRQKVEKQVYQKFEKILIDKLNYLVDKKKAPAEEGGLLRAYQLTGRFISFQKLGKQSGFLFYVPAWNTSKIDPITGFVNLFDTRYENIDKAKKFFSKFDFIRYNLAKDWFEFSFDYNNFTQKAENTKTHWTVCTQGTRIETFRNVEKNLQWDSKEVNLTDVFKQFFVAHGIDINGDLKEKISTQERKDFFYNDSKDHSKQGLLQLFRLMLQMRNSVTGEEIDYLISPVADAEGRFYDSRICDDVLPVNADANGAYNIARKGLWVIEQIKRCEDWTKLKLAISNKEWLQFAQEKPYLKVK